MLRGRRRVEPRSGSRRCAPRVEERLAQLQRRTRERLEQMRATVDEKLQGTLEKRLGESFKLVSERLEAVHKGSARCRRSRPASATSRRSSRT